MRKFLILVLICCACSSSSHKYRLAICAIFKNEAAWLKEWVSYHHHVLGVEHFYLYNNESTDGYLDSLQPFIDEGVVEVIDWDSANPDHLASGAFMDAPWSATQLGAYNNCLQKKALGQAKWVAMIDVDEFIVPVKGVKSFYALLDLAEKNKKGTVSMMWRVFGTSNVKELNPGELLTEKLTWRAADEHPWNQLYKSIHRPEGVEFCLVHTARKLNPGFGSRTLKADQVRVHHYWARTENFCEMKRGQTKEKDPAFFEAFQKIEDTTIHQYLSKLMR